MADIKELKSALLNAHKAGDTKAAKALANEIKRIQSSPEQLTEDYKTKPWPEVGGEALSNIPSSAMQMGEDLATAVMNPIDTGAAAVEVGFGALSKLYPDWYINFLDEYLLPDDTLKTAMQKADMVGQAMVDRYGSMEGFKRTLAQDPVGVMADAAGVLSMGGGAAVKTGAQLPKLVGAGQKLQSAASFVDPLSLASKGAGTVFKGASKLPSAVAGMTTGMGGDVVDELYKAGKKGGRAKETALKHMRLGDEVGEKILTMARDGMEKLRSDRRNAYKSGMIDIKNDPTILDFSKVEEAFAKTVNENTLGGVAKSKAKDAALREVSKELSEWKSYGPELMTPEGLDALKQRIGEMVDWKNKSDATNQAYLGVYDSIRNEINKQAPVYGKIMGDYHDASKQIKEMEKALSLKDNASADTAFRKLSQSLRNNMNTNFGQRGKLVGELQEATGAPLKPAIAGQAANSWMPRGIVGSMIGAGNVADIATGGGLTTSRLATLPLHMPRVVGETAVGVGSLARRMPKLPSNVRVPSQFRNAVTSLPIRSGAIQAGRLPQLEEELQRRKLLGE